MFEAKYQRLLTSIYPPITAVPALISENIPLIQNSADGALKLSTNPRHITFNTVNKDPGISHPHLHPHPLPGRRGIGAK